MLLVHEALLLDVSQDFFIVFNTLFVNRVFKDPWQKTVLSLLAFLVRKYKY